MIGEIIADFAVPLELHRRGNGTMVNGRYFKGAITVTPLDAAVVPAVGETLQRLPEGLRTERVIQLFSETALRTVKVAGNDADEVLYSGKLYQIHHVSDWNDQGGFYDCLAVMRAQDGEEDTSYTVYFGVSDDDAITLEADVLALSGRIETDDGDTAFTVNAGDGEYIYFVHPESFGDLTFFVEDLPGGVTELGSVTVDGVLCTIRRSVQPTLGNVAVRSEDDG